MNADEANREKLLEGYRRAHSWLRFRELGDEAAITELRSEFADPVDYVWISAGLAARTRWFLQALFVTARQDLQDAHRQLDELADTNAFEDWRGLAEARLEIAYELGQQWHPIQQRRLDLYEKAALDGLEAESPDSKMRRRMFES